MSLHVESVSRSAKNNNTYPQCKYFYKECFTQQKVCEEHEGLYDELNLTADHVRAAWLRLKVATA